MKQIILSLVIATSTLAPVTAQANENQIGNCHELYAMGWDNMGLWNQMSYVLWCKPKGYQ